MGLERDFEKFEGGPVVSTRDRVHVTLSALGVIYLNQTAYEHFGKPAAVALYYSRERDTIAIEPANPRFEKSFPVKQCQNGWRILAGPFLGHFNIRTTNTIRFAGAEVDESGIMMLDLRTTVNVTARRYSQNRLR